MLASDKLWEEVPLIWQKKVIFKKLIKKNHQGSPAVGIFIIETVKQRQLFVIMLRDLLADAGSGDGLSDFWGTWQLLLLVIPSHYLQLLFFLKDSPGFSQPAGNNSKNAFSCQGSHGGHAPATDPILACAFPIHRRKFLPPSLWPGPLFSGVREGKAPAAAHWQEVVSGPHRFPCGKSHTQGALMLLGS